MPLLHTSLHGALNQEANCGSYHLSGPDIIFICHEQIWCKSFFRPVNVVFWPVGRFPLFMEFPHGQYKDKVIRLSFYIKKSFSFSISRLTFIFKVHDTLFSSMGPTALRYLNLNGSKWVSCSFSTTFLFTADLKGAIKVIQLSTEIRRLGKLGR